MRQMSIARTALLSATLALAGAAVRAGAVVVDSYDKVVDALLK